VAPYTGRIREDGKFFHVLLKDGSQCEIMGTFFDEAVDRFLPMLSLGRVYHFSGGSVRASRSSPRSDRQDCVLIFNSDARVVEVDDPSAAAVSLSFSYTSLAELPALPPNRDVDVLVWAYSAEAANDVQLRKSNTMAPRRRVEVCDRSGFRCELTLWHGEAIAFPDEANCVVSVKDARINSFNGRSLGLAPGSVMSIDPDTPEARDLRQWATGGVDFTALPSVSVGSDLNTPYAYLAQINEQQLGSRERPDYVTCVVLCADVPVGRKMYYQACPTPGCKFKGFANRIPGDNSFVCERCHQATATPKLRYNFPVKLVDFSGSMQVGVLGDDGLGAMFTGVGVDDWVSTTNDGQNQQVALGMARKRFFHPLQVKCRIKTDVYNNVTRVKASLMNVSKLGFAEGARFYYGEIEKFVIAA
jgi:replication factor A1